MSACVLQVDETCVYSMTEDECLGNPAYNALNYVLSSFALDVPCRGPMLASMWNDKTMQINNTNVNYLCANETEAQQYTSSLETVDDVMPPNVSLKFEYKLPVGDDGEANCQFDENTGAYRCNNQTSVDDVVEDPLPSYCEWDDGHTRPPRPRLSDDTQTCENVVLDVLYNFTWSGDEVILLNATIILGAVTLNTTSSTGADWETTRVTQWFNTVFIHDYIPESDNDTDASRGRYKRSGNPGMETRRQGFWSVQNVTSDLDMSVNEHRKFAWKWNNYNLLLMIKVGPNNT